MYTAHRRHRASHGISLFTACFVALVHCSVAAQKPSSPQRDAPSASPTDFRFERYPYVQFPWRIELITKDQVVLRFSDLPPSVASHRLAFQVGAPLPYSDYVLARTVIKWVEENKVRMERSEIVVRDSSTGKELTISPYTDTAGAMTQIYRFELVRADGSRLRIELGQEFESPVGSGTKYQMLAVTVDDVSVRRLTDGSKFHLLLYDRRSLPAAGRPK